MSKISFNEDHKIKLIQMTEFIMYDYDIEINSNNEIQYQHKRDSTKSGSIYWLEHVIFHLAKKILNRDDSSILQFHTRCLTNIFPENGSTNPFHPINYLYDRYKKNKEQAEKQFKLSI